MKYLLDKYISSTERLTELYDDKDGQRKAEVAALTGPNEFQEFYNRLKQIKDFYRKHPNEVYKYIFFYTLLLVILLNPIRFFLD